MSVPPEDVDRGSRTPRARDFYLAYLSSPAWKARRNRALRLANWRCQRCAAKRDLQVHHKTYERLGKEWDQDLEVVCVNCHEGEHITQATKSPDGIYLRLASEALKATPFSTVAELSETVKVACARHHISYDAPAVHRVIGLVTGSRLTRREHVRYLTEIAPGPPPLSKQEAHELMTRLHAMAAIRTMPTGYGDRDQLGHEARLARQVADEQRVAYQRDQQRQSLLEQLAAIFTRAS